MRRGLSEDKVGSPPAPKASIVRSKEIKHPICKIRVERYELPQEKPPKLGLCTHTHVQRPTRKKPSLPGSDGP